MSNLDPVVFALMGQQQNQQPAVVKPPDTFNAIVAQGQWQQNRQNLEQDAKARNLQAAINMIASML